MQDIYKFLLQSINLKLEDIISLEKIETGFTNHIYHLILKNKKEYKVRIANNHPFINRPLEKKIEFTFNEKDIIYYDNSGNFIKNWIVGKSLNKNNLSEEFWYFIFQQINILQSITTLGIEVKKISYIPNISKVDESLKNAFKLYQDIVSNINEEQLVLSHNDLSSGNIIFNNGIATVIDFEWASFNHPYWDVANLIKDLELNYEEVISNKIFQEKCNLDLLIKIIFATHFYTYFWTQNVEPTKRILKYQAKIMQRILYWEKFITK
ncbi:MAG: phosphotransferase [Metamycoplasmataceae bacterium]